MNLLKLLIVEDNLLVAQDIKETLEKSGHRVIAIVKNYSQAMDAIQRELPELIIIDIGLKEPLEGIEIATDVSKNYGIPFIFLTGYTDPRIFEVAKQTNPASYLTKPLRQQELVFQIELAYAHFVANKKEDNNPIKAESVYLPVNRMLHQKIDKSDVLFLQAKGACVMVYVIEMAKPYEFSMHLGYLSQYFSSNNFYQISRSLIINLNYLDTITADYLTLKFYEEQIPLPHNKKGELMRKLAVIKTP